MNYYTLLVQMTEYCEWDWDVAHEFGVGLQAKSKDDIHTAIRRGLTEDDYVPEWNILVMGGTDEGDSQYRKDWTPWIREFVAGYQDAMLQNFRTRPWFQSLEKERGTVWAEERLRSWTLEFMVHKHELDRDLFFRPDTKEFRSNF